MYDLEQAWEGGPDGEGFYVLRGGSNWASVEGHASEWAEIATAIKAGRPAQFRRCAVAPDRGGFAFWSPRNACSPSDTVWVDAADAKALAARIVAVLREHGEPCVLGSFDPIYLGA